MSQVRVARITPGGWREVGPLAMGFARIAGRVLAPPPALPPIALPPPRPRFGGGPHSPGRLRRGARLSRRESELVIIRVASRRGSAYELTQHRRLGRRAGLSAPEIAAIEEFTEQDAAFSTREALLLRASDELLADQDLSDDLWGELGAAFDDRERIEILMLVGHYSMLATALHTLRVQPDAARRSRRLR